MSVTDDDEAPILTPSGTVDELARQLALQIWGFPGNLLVEDVTVILNALGKRWRAMQRYADGAFDEMVLVNDAGITTEEQREHRRIVEERHRRRLSRDLAIPPMRGRYEP